MDTLYDRGMAHTKIVCHEVLETAIRSAVAGCEQLNRFFTTQVNIETKGIANFVSEADFASEKSVVQTIRQSFPTHAIISEESHADRADSDHLWVIDPLDGTSNFLHGIPHFAVSIGYYEYGKPVVAVVCNPVTNDWYVSVAGQGSWHNGVRSLVSSAQRLNQSMVCFGFYYDRGRMMQATLDTIADLCAAEIHGIRRFGAAALDLCNVGCGQYELFFEYKLHSWDFAAGQLYLTEAGGTATDCYGQPLSIRNATSSICASNSHIHAQALAVIDAHWRAFQNG